MAPGEHPAGPAGPRMAQGQTLGEAAFAAVVAVAVFAAGASLGLQVNPAFLVSPVPLVLVAIRHGALVGGLTVGFAAGVVGAAHLPGAAAATFTLEIGLPALVLGLCLRRNVSLEWTVILGGASLCAAFLGELAVRAGGLRGVPAAYREVTAEVDARLGEAQQASEGPGGQELAGVGEAAAALRLVARKGFPGLRAAEGLLVAAALTTLAVGLAARTVGAASPPFTWTLPEGMVWGLIAAGAATLAPWGPWHVLGLNTLLVLLALYLLQGLSILGFFARRLELPWYLRALALLLVAAWPPLMLLAVVVTVAVGLFDVWVAFRRADAPRWPGGAR